MKKPTRKQIAQYKRVLGFKSTLLDACQQATPATKEDFIEPTGALRGHDKPSQATVYSVPYVDEFKVIGRPLSEEIDLVASGSGGL